MSKSSPTLSSSDPRPPRLVLVNPRQHTKSGLCMPNGELMRRPMRLPEGTYLWTGDNRLARVGTYGLKVFTHAETAREITSRMARKAHEEQVKGSTERLFRKFTKENRLRRLKVLWPLVAGLTAFLAALGLALYGAAR